eukprot:1323461-Amorphochlora_amoeboformis.AAC.1
MGIHVFRLGLWGPKTAFEDFIQFHNTIKPEKKGRGFGRNHNTPLTELYPQLEHMMCKCAGKNHPGEMPMMEIVGKINLLNLETSIVTNSTTPQIVFFIMLTYFNA